MQKMINAFKTFRTQSPALTFSAPLPPPLGLGRKASWVRFKQTTTLRSSESDSEHNMDKPEPNPTEKTRCDDDGFGVVYGGIRSVTNTEEDENHPAVDKSQGSEVQEKEEARHQTYASS
ncbi:unnamed protein product [Prunus armeniaca]|uniref:Uncharacterized protein n=1 Tax=Prunus armeniaca TaxID=36596 RepID=A0A6J5Y0G2_PRUAR|nr:unnamed protein product [Prunus armeniaca]